MNNIVSDWGEVLQTSLANAVGPVAAAIPKLLAFLAIIIIGWIIAALIARALVSILRSVKFNRLARRSGFTDIVEGLGVHTSATVFLANVAKWFVRLIAIVVAFDALGLPAVSDVLERLLLWLPNLAVATIVLVVGGLAANAAARLVQTSAYRAGLESASVIGASTKLAVWAFALIIAVNELGVAETTVNALLIAVLSALALASGLAFGLGGQQAAAELIDSGRQRLRTSAPKFVAAARHAEDVTSGETDAAVEPEVLAPDAQSYRKAHPSHHDDRYEDQHENEHADQYDDNVEPAVASTSTATRATHRAEPLNHGKPWTETDLAVLQEMAEDEKSPREIALRLKRTEDAVMSKAYEHGVSLTSVTT